MRVVGVACLAQFAMCSDKLYVLQCRRIKTSLGDDVECTQAYSHLRTGSEDADKVCLSLFIVSSLVIECSHRNCACSFPFLFCHFLSVPYHNFHSHLHQYTFADRLATWTSIRMKSKLLLTSAWLSTKPHTPPPQLSGILACDYFNYCSCCCCCWYVVVLVFFSGSCCFRIVERDWSPQILSSALVSM